MSSLPETIVGRGSRDHYEDADLYDYEYRRRRDDVRFYRELAADISPEPAEILELCCGSGRLTAGLLRDGHRVVGLDHSAAMLRRARRRIFHISRAARERALLLRGDMCRFALGRRYPLTIMGFNSFEHLYSRVEVSACLARVRDHLEPGGRFAFDVQMPDLEWLRRDPRKRWARTTFRHPISRQRLEYSTNHDYDAVDQIALIRIFYKPLEPGPLRRTRIVHLSQRKFFPAELEALVAAAGYRIVWRGGDFAGASLSADSESQVVICEPRTA